MAISFHVDAGAEYLRPFAKRLVEKLHSEMKQTGRTATLRDFAIDDTTLIHIESFMVGEPRLAYFTDRVRITSGIPYLVNTLLPNMVPFRSLFLDSGFGQPLTQIQPPYNPPIAPDNRMGAIVPYFFYDASGADSGIVGNPGTTLGFYGVRDGLGNEYSRFTGTEVVTAGGGKIVSVTANMPVSILPGFFALAQGTDTTPNDPGDDSTIIFVAIDGSGPTNAYNAALSSYNAAAASYLAQYNANAAARLQVTMSDGEIVAFVPQTTVDGSFFSPSYSGPWLGEEGTLISTGNFPFAVPTDTKSSLAGATAVAREKARLISDSEDMIDMLKAGILPATAAGRWSVIIKINALRSVKPRQLIPFTAVLTTAEVPNFTSMGAPNTVYGPITVSRGVQLSYVDADGVLHSDVVQGTWTQQSFQVGFKFYITNTYANFPIFSVVSGGLVASVQGSGDGPVGDGGTQLGVIVNGSSILGQVDTSEFGTPTDPTTNPGVPESQSNLVFSVANLYTEYLNTIKPKSVDSLTAPLPPFSVNWLSSSIVVGSTVSVVPYGPVKDGVDLGMFGIQTGAQKIAIYGVATFKYNRDGSFTFNAWRDAQPETEDDVAGPKILDFPLTWTGANTVMKFGQAGWKDTQVTAKAQKALMRDPVTNNDKILALVKGAVNL